MVKAKKRPTTHRSGSTEQILEVEGIDFRKICPIMMMWVGCGWRGCAWHEMGHYDGLI